MRKAFLTALGAVRITEKEFSIAPATVSVPGPGLYVISVANKGRTAHALAIEGHGVDAKTKDIPPGASAPLGQTSTQATTAGSSGY